MMASRFAEHVLNNRFQSNVCHFMVEGAQICGTDAVVDEYGRSVPACMAHFFRYYVESGRISETIANDDEAVQEVPQVRRTPPVLPTFDQWENNREEQPVLQPVTPMAPFHQTRFDTIFSPRAETHGFATFDSVPTYIEPARECCVCFEDRSLLSLPCRHVTCFACLERLPVQSCPLCRAEIVFSFVRRL